MGFFIDGNESVRERSERRDFLLTPPDVQATNRIH